MNPKSPQRNVKNMPVAFFLHQSLFRVDPCKMIHEDMKQIHENPKLSELERNQQSIEFLHSGYFVEIWFPTFQNTRCCKKSKTEFSHDNHSLVLDS